MANLLHLKEPGQRAKRILVKYLPTVPDVIKANLVPFNNRLVTEALVAHGVYDPQNRIYTNDQSATALYEACMRTVEIDPSKFSTLMDVLIEYPLLENTVKEMTATGKHPLSACMLFQQQLGIKSFLKQTQLNLCKHGTYMYTHCFWTAHYTSPCTYTYT